MTIWKLTIHYWARVASGAEPVAVTSVGSEYPDGAYRPHDILFTKPPSRDDFMAVYNQTPWMSTWKDDLIPCLIREGAQWPIVSSTQKSGSADITEDDGNVVGRITVYRESLEDAEGYDRYRCDDTFSPTCKATARIPEDRRQDAEYYMLRHGNLLKERILTAKGEKDDATKAEVRRMLQEGGFLVGKTKSKTRS